MKIKKHVFKIGEKVKIITPDIFVRCGYPWSKKYVEEKVITNEEKQKIYELLGINLESDINADYYVPYRKMIDGLCIYKLQINKFGGRERRIHTVNKPELKDKIAEITGKKVVKTGDYVSGGGGYSYDGEYDYEPPYLENEKSHVILSLYLSPSDWSYDINDLSMLSSDMRIEEKNVEKLEIDEQPSEY